MNTLIVNAGSTTIKFKLFDEKLQEILSGNIDNIHGKYIFKLHKENKKYEWEIGANGFANASEAILKEICDYEVATIGFRIVHGGEKYIKPTLLTDQIINELDNLSELAPLHNPPAIRRIREFRRILPDVKMFGVFDTAFHNTMPEKSYLYALPYELYEQYKIRRYGFHGTSHKYVAEQFHKMETTATKVISCHLGGGASMTAIKNGKSIDTSMGFTPLEGLIMATRPGDIDDGAIHYLMDKMHMTVKDMQRIENKYSGLLGISGNTSDMRELLILEKEGDKRASLAVNMYIYRIHKYIGMYAAAMNGLDGLIFTAGVGAGSDEIRLRIVEGLSFLNLKIDNSLNEGQVNVDKNLKISSKSSAPIWVIPTNEELQIAREIK